MAPDRSEAEYAENLAVEQRYLAAGPATPSHFCVNLREAPGNGKQQRKRMLGDRNGRNPRRVGYRYSVSRRGSQIDIIGPGAPNGDQTKPRRAGKDTLAEPR